MANKFKTEYYKCTKCDRNFITIDDREFYSDKGTAILKKQPELSTCTNCKNNFSNGKELQ